MGRSLFTLFLTSVLALSCHTFNPTPVRASERHPHDGDLLAFFGFGGSKRKSPLNRKQRELARTMLAQLEKEARLILFSESEGCKKCGKTARLLEELSSTSPRLSLETLSLEENAELAADLGIDKVPGIAILDGAGEPVGIRYYGLPLGFEFEPFLQAVVNSAHGSPGLEAETVAGLGLVTKPVTITLFVTEH